MICSECPDFEIYHDCDDPDILPKHRTTHILSNCAQWMCSGKCMHGEGSSMSENKTVWYVRVEKTMKKELDFEVIADTREEAIEKAYSLVRDDCSNDRILFCYNKGERV